MSSERALLAIAVFLATCALAPRSDAQQAPQGFAVERLSPPAAGGGWFVMDSLDMGGTLGGAAALTLGYAHDPLRVRSNDGAQRLAVVSDQAFADFGFAVTYRRWRLHLNLDMPVAIKGRSGAVGGYTFTAPDVDPGNSPDTLSDARVGLEARLVGEARGAFRLGAGAELVIPSGTTCAPDPASVPANQLRCDYDTDGTYRAMARVLAAGDIGAFTYAAQLGAHVRPRDDTPIPGAPEGSELLFGVAAGARLRPWGGGAWLPVVGGEIFGATPFRAPFGSATTALEALATARVEGTADDGAQLRVKIGIGPGLSQHLGAPEWRAVVAVEVFDRGGDRDGDGISDARDACPDTPGVGTNDPKRNGCPRIEGEGDGAPR